MSDQEDNDDHNERLRHQQVVSLLDDLFTRDKDGTVSLKEGLLSKLRIVVRHLSRPDNSIQYAHFLIGSLEKVQHSLLPILVQYRDNESHVRHISAVISEILAPVGPEVTDYIDRRRQQRQIKRAFQREHYTSLINAFSPQLKNLLTLHAATPSDDVEHILTYLGIFQLLLVIDDDHSDPNPATRHCHDLALTQLHQARFFKLLSAIAVNIHLIGHVELANVVLELLSFALKFEKPNWLFGQASHDNYDYSHFYSVSDTLSSRYAKRFRVAIDVDTLASKKSDFKLQAPNDLSAVSTWKRSILSTGHIATPAGTYYSTTGAHGGNKVNMQETKVGRIYSAPVAQLKKSSERYEMAKTILEKERNEKAAHNVLMAESRREMLGMGAEIGANGETIDSADNNPSFGAIMGIGPDGRPQELNFDLEQPGSLLVHHPTRLSLPESKEQLSTSLQRIGGSGAHTYFTDYDFLQDFVGDSIRSYFPPTTVNTVNDIFHLLTEGHPVDLDYIREQERQKVARKQIRKLESAIYKLNEEYEKKMQQYNKQIKDICAELILRGILEPGQPVPEQAIAAAQIKVPKVSKRMQELQLRLQQLKNPQSVQESTTMVDVEITGEGSKAQSKGNRELGLDDVVERDVKKSDVILDGNGNVVVSLPTANALFNHDSTKSGKFAYGDDSDEESAANRGALDDLLEWPFQNTSTSSSLLFFVFNNLDYDKNEFEVDEILYLERIFILASQCLSYWKNKYIQENSIDLVKMMLDAEADEALFASSYLSPAATKLRQTAQLAAETAKNATNSVAPPETATEVDQNNASPTMGDGDVVKKARSNKLADSDDEFSISRAPTMTNPTSTHAQSLTRSGTAQSVAKQNSSQLQRNKLVGAAYPVLSSGDRPLLPEQLDINNLDFPIQQHTPFSKQAKAQHNTPHSALNAADVPIKRMKHPKPLYDFSADHISFIFNDQIITILEHLLKKSIEKKAFQFFTASLITYVREFLETLLLIQCCGDYTSKIHAMSLRVKITISHEVFIWIPKLLWRTPTIQSSDVLVITQLILKLLVYMNREFAAINKLSQYQQQSLRFIETDIESSHSFSFSATPPTLGELYGIDANDQEFNSKVVTHFTNDLVPLPVSSFDGLVTMQYNNLRLFDVLGQQCFQLFAKQYHHIAQHIEREREKRMHDIQKEIDALNDDGNVANDGKVSTKSPSKKDPLLQTHKPLVTASGMKKPTGPLTEAQKQLLRRQQIREQMSQQKEEKKLRDFEEEHSKMGENRRKYLEESDIYEQLQRQQVRKEKIAEKQCELDQLRASQLTLLQYIDCIENGKLLCLDGVVRDISSLHSDDLKANTSMIINSPFYLASAIETISPQQEQRKSAIRFRFLQKMERFTTHTVDITEYEYLTECIPTSSLTKTTAKLHITHILTCLKNYRKSSPLLLYSLLSFANTLCYKYGRFAIFFNLPSLTLIRQIIHSFPLSVTQTKVSKDPQTNRDITLYYDLRNDNVYFWSILNLCLKLTQSMFTRASTLLSNSCPKAFYISMVFNFSTMNWGSLANPNGYFRSRESSLDFFGDEGALRADRAKLQRGEMTQEQYLSRLALDGSKYNDDSESDDDVFTEDHRRHQRLHAEYRAQTDDTLAKKFKREEKNFSHKTEQAQWLALPENKGKTPIDYGLFVKAKLEAERTENKRIREEKKAERQKEVQQRRLQREKKARRKAGEEVSDDGWDEDEFDDDGKLVKKRNKTLDNYDDSWVMADSDAEEEEQARRKARKSAKKATPKKKTKLGDVDDDDEVEDFNISDLSSDDENSFDEGDGSDKEAVQDAASVPPKTPSFKRASSSSKKDKKAKKSSKRDKKDQKEKKGKKKKNRSDEMDDSDHLGLNVDETFEHDDATPTLPSQSVSKKVIASQSGSDADDDDDDDDDDDSIMNTLLATQQRAQARLQTKKFSLGDDENELGQSSQKDVDQDDDDALFGSLLKSNQPSTPSKRKSMNTRSDNSGDDDGLIHLASSKKKQKKDKKKERVSSDDEPVSSYDSFDINLQQTYDYIPNTFPHDNLTEINEEDLFN